MYTYEETIISDLDNKITKLEKEILRLKDRLQRAEESLDFYMGAFRDHQKTTKGD